MDANSFAPYLVTYVKDENPLVRTLRIQPADGRPVFPFLPGQFVWLRLPTPSGVQGSFHRAYSLAGRPGQPYLEISYKLRGSFTHVLHALRMGDRIECSAPEGRSHFQDGLDYVFVAGGIGITPVLSILRHAAAIRSKSRLTLLYSNRTPDDVAFLEELRKLQAENPNLRVVHTLTRAPADPSLGECLAGRFDEEKIRALVPQPAACYWFLCGGVEMTKALLPVLSKNLGVPMAKIQFESWG